jgi:hypothetical protein
MGLLVGMIGRSHQGPDGCMGKAHVFGLALEHLEGVGVHITTNWQMAD